jgi:tripartite ATP-independent transporter DctM subunit
MNAIGFTVAGTLLSLLAGGVWISLSLLGAGIVVLSLFRNMPVDRLLAQNMWNTATIESLLSLPLFILMAEILFRTRLSALMFNGLMPWTARLPGRLLHVNVLGCTLFAAVCGSSAATAATVGRITLGELFSRGYDRDVVIGSLAGAGTLGLMIPPSFILIVYGVLAEESILKLFIAGVIPGLMLAGSFMLYIGVIATLKPGIVPTTSETVTWSDRIRALTNLGPILGLILMIMGSMYGGLASPTEAAAVGVFGAALISVLHRSFTWANIRAACLSAAVTSSMLGLITVAAVFLSVAMAFLGVPRFVAEQIAALQLSPAELVLLLLVFYLILGCFLEGMSAIVMTLPIVLPLVLAAGYDKIWLGIFLVLVVEMAQITPPVGFNLFVIQGMTGEGIARIARAAFPFFLIMAIVTGVVAVFPGITTFLPNLLF